MPIKWFVEAKAALWPEKAAVTPEAQQQLLLFGCCFLG